MKSALSFDTTFILNLGLLFAGCSTIIHYTRELLYSIAKYYYISSVEIEGIDPVYAYLMQWMTTHQIKMTSKTVKATAWPQNTEADYEDSPLFQIDDGKDGPEGSDKPKCRPVNYRGTDKLGIRFVPSKHYTFWHRGNRFVFQHSIRKTEQRADILNLDNIINLDCWGRSLKPIRDILKEAQDEFLDASGMGTGVFSSSDTGGGMSQWRRITLRPARQLDTVIMDTSKKQALVDDMNEYLLPATRKWYAAHGIPYRRGYLFSGMPGTGKTSLAFALAGVFGLAIYSISLADPDVAESELTKLFSMLPRRCVVLLEDIDAAGLKRSGRERDELVLNRTLKDSSSHKGLSLSELLNVLDGVTSQEGRVLIMTTNIPEALDPALIRPGRIDMSVHFGFATRSQLRELFISMYSDTKEYMTKISSSATVDDKKISLPELADTFAAMLPPDRLTLAAVQGHLLHYKHDPRKAVLNAENWLKTTLDENENSQHKTRKVVVVEKNGTIDIDI